MSTVADNLEAPVRPDAREPDRTSRARLYIVIARAAAGLTLALLWLLQPAPPVLNRQELQNLMKDGELAVKTARYNAALIAFTKAFEQEARTGQVDELAYARVANMNRLLDNVDLAKEQFEAALRLIRTSHAPETGSTYREEAFILAKLGAIEEQLGNNDLARQRLGEALAAYEYAGVSAGHTREDLGNQVFTLLRLSGLDTDLLNLDDARQLVAWAAERCGGSCGLAADIVRTRGDIELAAERFTDALRLYQEALTIYPPNNHQELANVNFLLGVASTHLARFDDARRYLDEAARHSPEQLSAANILLGRGELEAATHHAALAHILFAQASDVYGRLKHRAGQADVAVEEGRLFASSEGNHQAAIGLFETAAAIYRSVQLPLKAERALRLAAASQRQLTSISGQH